MKRIALIEINQESNSFAPDLCTLEDFKNNYLYFGEEIIKFLSDTGTELGGFLKRLSQEQDIEVVPILAAHAVPSGLVKKTTIEFLTNEVIHKLSTEIKNSLDGIGLVLHGAMVGENIDDFEGYLLKEIRRIVGPEIPIVASLDLHAHLTQKMVDSATALIGYRHYPHDDTYDTGYRSSDLLLKTIRNEVYPYMSMIKLPMIVPVNNMQTFEGPMRKILDREYEIEKSESVLSSSVFPVQAWLDVPGTGFTSLVITDNDEKYAKEYSINLAKLAWKLRWDFTVKTYSVEEAINKSINSSKKPVLLVDSADSIGGGAPGDSIFVLKKLMSLKVNEPSILSIVNPIEVKKVFSHAIGDTVKINLSSSTYEDKDNIVLEGVIRHMSNGKFRYNGGIFNGTEGTMGNSVLISVKNINILLVSFGTYEWDDAQYRSMGVDVEKMKYVVVKMPMNYKITYRNIAEDEFILETPGPMNPNLKSLPFKKITRPLFPFENFDDNEVKMIIESQVK